MRILSIAFVAVLGAVGCPLAAQHAPRSTRLVTFVGLAPDPVTAAVGLEGRYRIGTRVALSATAAHWFLAEGCDAIVGGVCSPSDAWMADVGPTIALADPSAAWQPYAAARIGLVRFNNAHGTRWTAGPGIGLTRTGRWFGFQAELRYHTLFGGTSPFREATPGSVLFQAGFVVTP